MVAVETAPKVLDAPELIVPETAIGDPGQLTRPERARAARAARRRSTRAVAAIAVVIAVAFGPALWSFSRVHPYPMGPGLIAPVSVLVLAFVLTRWRRAEPPIHDRHLDWIIGVPLLACAAAMMLWLPTRLSLEFWEHRLDLLALPLLVAGAIGVLFGSRVLWRLLPAIVLLTLVCPWLWSGPGVAIAVLVAMALVVLRSRGASPRRVRPTSRGRRPRGLATGRPAAAVIVVAVAAACVVWGTVRASGYSTFVDPLGMPRTSEIGTSVAIADGFRFPVPADPEVTRRAFGPEARWIRATALGTPALHLDLVTVPSRDGLSALAIRDGHIAPRARTVRTWRVRLSHGLSGLATIGRQHDQGRRWVAVTGAVPVQTARGNRVQQFTVQRRVSGSTQESVDQVVSSATGLVRAAAGEARR